MRWLSGWLNLLGQVAFTAGLEYALASAIASTVSLATGGRGVGVELPRGAVLGVLVALLGVRGAVPLSRKGKRRRTGRGCTRSGTSAAVAARTRRPPAPCPARLGAR